MKKAGVFCYFAGEIKSVKTQDVVYSVLRRPWMIAELH